MRVRLVSLFAVAIVGCAHSEGARPTAAEPAAPVARTTVIPMAHVKPASNRDLRLRVDAPERIGPIEEAKTVALTLAVTNESDDWISVHPTHAVIDVFDNGERVEGCQGFAQLALPPILAPNETLQASATVPCAIPEGGDYDVVATVAVGELDGFVVPPTQVSSSAQAHLVIDPELQSPSDASMPIAEVPPASTHAFPSRVTADALETEEPG